MNGLLIVRPNVKLKSNELVNCQKSIVKMLKDGVVVIPPGYEVSYIDSDNPSEDTKVGFE